MAAPGETYRLAFSSASKPHISTGLPFPAACAHHISNTYNASKVYVIVSNSISKTANFTKLQEALGDKIVGVRKGIKPHTPWDDVLEIVHDVRTKEADIIVTLGAGSLTDGAKVISFVRSNPLSSTYTNPRRPSQTMSPASMSSPPSLQTPNHKRPTRAPYPSSTSQHPSPAASTRRSPAPPTHAPTTSACSPTRPWAPTC